MEYSRRSILLTIAAIVAAAAGGSNSNNMPMINNIERPECFRDKVAAVHKWVSTNITWADDMTLYNVDDYWATPWETLNIRSGDCEDIAILKYFLMLKSGVPIENLRIAFVKMARDGKTLAHMVLCYHTTPEDTNPEIIDCVTTTISNLNKRTDLTMVYSFNDQNLWVGNSKIPTGVNPENSLRAWKEVKARMVQEINDNKWY